MSSPPDIDPYAVLGVSKEAPLSEIRAAHRKRVLKCHPDKIQDESQRNVAQDEFQKVQQAYELLSDDTRRNRYDQQAKLAELKRELLERRRADSAYSSPRGSGSSAREYREGRIVEERVPAEVFLDEAMRFTDSPRPMSRKFDEFGMRPKPRAAEEKKKPRAPTSSYRAAKELARETAKATHSDRAKHRDKERRRQASEKFDRFGPYEESSDDGSDSSDSAYDLPKRPSASRRERELRSRPAEFTRRRERRFDDDYGDQLKSKLNNMRADAEDYIERSKFDVDRRRRLSRSPPRHRGYESTEPESSASRRSGRSTRSTRHRSSSRNDSYEHLESRNYEKPPKMPTATTSPSLKNLVRPAFLSSRSATTSASGFTRPKREGSSRPDPDLYNMSREPIPPRPSKLRERNDSGYSSPSTPEMPPPRGNSPKTSRYKIVTEPEAHVIEPLLSKSSKYRGSTSPDRVERSASSARMPHPKRGSSYTTYIPESAPRVEVRPSRPSRPAHGDVEYTTRVKDQDVKYTREIRPGDATIAPGRSRYYYDDYHHPPVGRRQSAHA
ncbi:hypothetical protein NUU61_009088 [Penicillium alfredii]|uniref:J domain-containing protein n=1 Tax=Penicillium alfredii TaxID=1506179 RepID=A0A9W9JWK8_9EURO|nr:uncharacterized protein NUU61_009088 [Penicillium alfredii]KAJ5084509.1 hypothetical protein NUU61_009088 [Penicillium alfredii]